MWAERCLGRLLRAGRVPHHSVALHSRQLEGGEALVVGNELQRLQVVPSIIGQQQVVHLTGEGFVGLQDEDVQHCVPWGGPVLMWSLV